MHSFRTMMLQSLNDGQVFSLFLIFLIRIIYKSPSLLSLGYTLVYNEISFLLDGLGFDPYLGFYHRPRFGHANTGPERSTFLAIPSPE